ncbi:MAG: tetratricopeptide repeat protein [Prevotella sp.]|nr:tetratricopeptide repeat protein [Prevotella sp.]
MDNTRELLCYSIFILLVFCVVSCKKTGNADRVLTTVENIVEQYPDSALILLDSISNSNNLSDKEENLYRLLQIQAKDKTYKDITSDTVIFQVRDYYKEKNDAEYLALASFYCGRVLQYQQKDTLAINEYLQAGIYAERTEDNMLKGLIESSMGAIFSSELVEAEAIKHFMKASHYFHRAKHTKNEIITYNQIGNAYLKGSKNDSAFYYYNKGLELAKATNDSLEIAALTHCLGIAYRETRQFDLAEKYIREASRYTNNNDDEIKQYLNLSKTFYAKNVLDSAKIYINKSLSLLSDNENAFVAAEIHLTLSEILEKQSDFNQSLDYYKQYTTYFKKILSENTGKEIADLKAKYNNERLQNENGRLKVRSLRIILFSSVALLVGCLIILGFYLKSVQQKRIVLKKENDLLEKENELLEARTRISQLVEMAESYNNKVDSDRNLLLHHFDILKRVSLLKQYLREDDEQSQRLVKKFNDIVYGQESMNWELLYQDMNSIHNGLFDRLKEQCPELDENEFRICCMAYAGFTCSETGIIIELSTHTVEMKRSSIRKKLRIEPKGSLRTYLTSLFGS